MSFLILVRHGQSIWNLEERFTGWVDVDLTEKGESEAKKAGLLIKEKNILINFCYSSLQSRAINTLKIIQNVLNDKKTFSRAWQLNERHYGALTGLNKIEMSKKIGEKKIHEFRRSWDIRPESLDKKSSYHPINIEKYKNIPKDLIPDTESLKDTYDRVIPYFKENIEKKINENVIISAHGNSIRSLCKFLFGISDQEISKLEIPTGNPLILEFDENIKLLNAKYLDNETAKDLLKFS